ncbi:hypothetical protein RN001_010557 [Aquatica leii]|uniref:Uncharacterized protein n=1 Tax=Aquatica leii TaxID=1421715 RepID=A0AAN7P9T2_9COLE|nr:hypothetical protein RN001_010557 [Aquatica leii]
MVSAKGVQPNFTITPDFLVCRLETRIGGSADCALEVNNCSTAPLSIDFVKVCEIEGAIIVIKDPKAKPIKLQKFSDTLNDEELNVISTCKKIIDPSCFRLLGASETGNLQVNPLSKVILKIVFGEPVDPLLKGKKKEKSKGTSPPKPKKYFIVKYNLLAGSKFIKDLIFIEIDMTENKEITLNDIMKKLLQVEGKVDETNVNMNRQLEKMKKLEETVNYQAAKIEKLENELRKKNLIIFGIPKRAEEDIRHLERDGPRNNKEENEDSTGSKMK